jgi:anti-anti-sigma factor
MSDDPDGTFLATMSATLQGQRADVSLSGDIDIAARPSLADVINRLAATTAETIVVDLAGVTFAGSVLANFLAGLRNAIPAGTVLVVCRSTPMTRIVLRITEMAQIALIRSNAVERE